jgi:exonuclease III
VCVRACCVCVCVCVCVLCVCVCVCVCVSIYMHNSCQFINLDLDKYCVEQDIEVCAITLNYCSANLCVLSIYRSPSGNFDTFLTNLEELLNNLIQNQNNIVICGDFNIDFMTKSTIKRRRNIFTSIV